MRHVNKDFLEFLSCRRHFWRRFGRAGRKPPNRRRISSSHRPRPLYNRNYCIPQHVLPWNRYDLQSQSQAKLCHPFDWNDCQNISGQNLQSIRIRLYDLKAKKYIKNLDFLSKSILSLIKSCSVIRCCKLNASSQCCRNSARHRNLNWKYNAIVWQISARSLLLPLKYGMRDSWNIGDIFLQQSVHPHVFCPFLWTN